MQHTLTWSIAKDTRGVSVALAGTINEGSSFERLVARLQDRSPWRIDLSAICHLTSSSIREWRPFIGRLSTSRPVELVRCSPTIVTLLNTFRDFADTARDGFQ